MVEKALGVASDDRRVIRHRMFAFYGGTLYGDASVTVEIPDYDDLPEDCPESEICIHVLGLDLSVADAEAFQINADIDPRNHGCVFPLEMHTVFDVVTEIRLQETAPESAEELESQSILAEGLTLADEPAVRLKGEDVESQAKSTALFLQTRPCYYFSEGYAMLFVYDEPEEGLRWVFDGMPLFTLGDGEYLLPIPNRYCYEGSLSEEGMDRLSLEQGSAVWLTYNSDVNLDGEVNIADANIVSQLINEGDSYYDADQLPLYQRVLADTDRDMRYTISDINRIVDSINSARN